MADLQHPQGTVKTFVIANVTTKAEQVPAPGAGYKVVVLSYTISLDAAGEFHWESASTDLMGIMELAADTPLVSNTPLFCAENEALNLTATAAANGHGSYIVVTNP
jgi:hypothetical protein